jgi:hypothetical protein
MLFELILLLNTYEYFIVKLFFNTKNKFKKNLYKYIFWF